MYACNRECYANPVSRTVDRPYLLDRWNAGSAGRRRFRDRPAGPAYVGRAQGWSSHCVGRGLRTRLQWDDAYADTFDDAFDVPYAGDTASVTFTNAATRTGAGDDITLWNGPGDDRPRRPPQIRQERQRLMVKKKKNRIILEVCASCDLRRD